LTLDVAGVFEALAKSAHRSRQARVGVPSLHNDPEHCGNAPEARGLAEKKTDPVSKKAMEARRTARNSSRTAPVFIHASMLSEDRQ
jgi:hypothetical protein